MKTKTKCYPYSTNTGSDDKIEALFVQVFPVTTKSNANQNCIHTSTSSGNKIKRETVSLQAPPVMTKLKQSKTVSENRHLTSFSK